MNRDLELFTPDTEEIERDYYNFDIPGNEAVFSLRAQNLVDKTILIQLFNSLGNLTIVPISAPFEVPKNKDYSGNSYSETVYESIHPVNEGIFWLFLMAMQSGNYSTPGAFDFITNIPVSNNPYFPTLDTDTGLIWVANSGSNTISVINPVTNTVIKTVLLAHAGSRNPVYDQFNKRMVCSCVTTAFVDFVDTSTYQVVASVNLLGLRPRPGAIDPVNKVIYIPTALGFDTCFAINLNTFAIEASLSDGIGLDLITPIYDPVHEKMYIGCTSSATVMVIDTNKLNPSYQTIINEIGVGAHPNNGAYDPITRTMFWGDGFGQTTVSAVQTDTDNYVSINVSDVNPLDVFYNAEKRKVIASCFAGSFSVINPVTLLEELSVPSDVGTRGGCYDPYRKYFIFPNQLSADVTVYDFNFNLIKTIGAGTAPILYPLFSNVSKSIYVSDITSNEVTVIGNKLDVSNDLLNAAIFDNFNGDLVYTNYRYQYGGVMIPDACLSYLTNGINSPIPAPIIKARISCDQIEYRQLLGELEDTVLKVKSIKVHVSDSAQFNSPLRVVRKTIFGAMKEVEIKPSEYVDPYFPNVKVLDIPLKDFYIDKKTTIFTKLLPGVDLLINFTVETYEVNFSFEKYFKLIK